MSSAYGRGAHRYEGKTNSRSQRSDSKAYRGVSRRDRVTVERLEALIREARKS